MQKLRERLTSLEIHKVGSDDFFQTWYCDKFPVIGENGNVLGVIVHNRPADSLSITRLKKIRSNTSLIFTPPDPIFSVKEWVVIFYTCQSFTPKMIENAIGLSHRTVEDILSRIYRKAEVRTKHSLLDYCIEHGYDKFIPQSIFHSCESIITAGQQR